MAVDLNFLRYTQFLAQPAGCKYPSSKAPEELQKFTLSNLAIKCLNLRVRMTLGKNITEAHSKIYRELTHLSKGCSSWQINGVRLLFAHLVFNPLSVHQENIIFAQKGGRLQRGQDWSDKWNSDVLNVFYLMEMEEPSDENFKAIAKAVEKLVHNLSLFPQQGVREPQEIEKISKNLEILQQCLSDREGLFPLLLIPFFDEAPSSLTEGKIKLYLNVLRLSRAATIMFRSHVRMQKAKYKVSFLSALSLWEEALETAQTSVQKLSSIKLRLEQGNPSAYQELCQHLKLVRGSYLHQIYLNLFISKFTEIKKDPEFSGWFDNTFRHSTALLTRFSLGLFEDLYMRTNAAVTFINALSPRLNVVSSTLTPLDLYWLWLASPLIQNQKVDERANEAIEKLEMLFQTLRNSVENCYGTRLEHVPCLFEELREINCPLVSKEALGPLEQIVQAQALELVIPWLNPPLLHTDSKQNDRETLKELQKLFYLHFENGKKLVEITQNCSDALAKDITSQNDHILSLGEVVPLEAFCQRALHLRSPTSWGLERLLDTEFPEESKKLIVNSLYYYEDLRTIYLQPFLKKGLELSLSSPKIPRKKQSKPKRHIVPPPNSPSYLAKTKTNRHIHPAAFVLRRSF